MKKLSLFLCSVVFVLLAGNIYAVSELKQHKPTLVLEKIKIRDRKLQRRFNGCDALLLEKLVHSKKYKVMNREAFDAYLREQAMAGNTGITIEADRSLQAELLDVTETGRVKGKAKESIIRMSLTITKMGEKEAQEVETIENVRLQLYSESAIDLMDAVISAVARKTVFAVSFACPEISEVDGGDVEINYGRSFLVPGEIFDVCSGAKGIRGKRVKGRIKVVECDRDFSIAKVLSGSIKSGYKLKIPQESIQPDLLPSSGSEEMKIVCVVESFKFASDFKGVGYKKTSLWGNLFELTGSIIKITDTAISRQRGIRKAKKITAIATPLGTELLFGSSAPCNFGFRPQMSRDQKNMLETALGTVAFIEMRAYKRLPRNLLNLGITHIVSGEIRGVRIDADAGVSTVVFSLKLVDASNNNQLILADDNIQVSIPGYYEPDTYSDALKAAVTEFVKNIPK